MTVVETLLVFLVAPLAVVLTAYGLVLLPGLKNRDRYKPGQPWGHAAVWYEPHRAGGAHPVEHDDDHAAISTGARASALAIGAAPHPSAPPARRTASGGARGTW